MLLLNNCPLSMSPKEKFTQTALFDMPSLSQLPDKFFWKMAKQLKWFVMTFFQLPGTDRSGWPISQKMPRVICYSTTFSRLFYANTKIEEWFTTRWIFRIFIFLSRVENRSYFLLLTWNLLKSLEISWNYIHLKSLEISWNYIHILGLVSCLWKNSFVLVLHTHSFTK